MSLHIKKKYPNQYGEAMNDIDTEEESEAPVVAAMGEEFGDEVV